MNQKAICQKVNQLVRRHKTRNPVELAQAMNIVIVIEELGSIRGYFNSVGRNKFIHINSNCRNRSLVCAHELGHAVLHPDASAHFMRKHTLFSVNRYEKEATYFASCLLIGDDDLTEYRHFTYEQLGKLFGIDEQIVKLRVEGF